MAAMTEKLQKLAEQHQEEMITIRRRLHENPELSMKEEQTTAFIKEQCREYGLKEADVELESGAVFLLNPEKAEKSIIFRADIDALPVKESTGHPFSSKASGVCHSCGHDIHTTALLFCARILSCIREELDGRVIFIFQPAEEVGKGANMVIKSGLFEKYPSQMIIGIHTWPETPAGNIGIRRGPFMAASDRLHITVRGKGGHGAHPHKSVDPVLTAAYILTQLQSVISRNVPPLQSAVITIGRITGGPAANVIPDEASMEGTVRTFLPEIRDMIEQRVTEIATHVAASMGADCTVDYHRGGQAVIGDDQVVARIEQAGREELGEDGVTYLETPSMGSEDFSNYLSVLPGAMLRLGTSNEIPESHFPLHNGKTIFDERAVIVGGRVLSRIAVDYLM
jgi:amidohydrolase